MTGWTRGHVRLFAVLVLLWAADVGFRHRPLLVANPDQRPAAAAVLIFTLILVLYAEFGARRDPALRWRLSRLFWFLVVIGAYCLDRHMREAYLLAYGKGHVYLPDPVTPMLWPFLLFAFDPAIVRGSRPGSIDQVFYDGSCGLCHKAVKFLLAEDTLGGRFRFAPLGGTTATAALSGLGPLPDSIVVVTADGRRLLKSSAVLDAMTRIGGYWRILGHVLSLVPRPLRDFAYDGVAKVRKRLFRTPDGPCPLLPPELRRYFDP